MIFEEEPIDRVCVHLSENNYQVQRLWEHYMYAQCFTATLPSTVTSRFSFVHDE